MDWLSLGAVVAGVLVILAWYKSENALTPESRRPWLIVRYAAIGVIVLWLVVEGPTLYRLIFQGGLE
jgi:uncharacterized membrane-anchored protein